MLPLPLLLLRLLLNERVACPAATGAADRANHSQPRFSVCRANKRYRVFVAHGYASERLPLVALSFRVRGRRFCGCNCGGVGSGLARGVVRVRVRWFAKPSLRSGVGVAHDWIGIVGVRFSERVSVPHGRARVPGRPWLALTAECCVV